MKSKAQSQMTKLVVLSALMLMALPMAAQTTQQLLYDVYHGQNPRNAGVFNELLPDGGHAVISLNEAEINESVLRGKKALILFALLKPLTDSEKSAITSYLRSGGSLLLIFDEERRTPLQPVGVNDVITPFGLSLTEDAPVRHNCGAIADKNVVCADKRELPYSGGRSIKGGTVISKVNDDGDYVHSAYVDLPGGGKLVVMSDGMAALLLGQPDGVRFSGTGPSDSRYWGKDSREFMEEIFAFLVL